MKRKSSRGVCDVCGCPVIHPHGHEYDGDRLVNVRCEKHALVYQIGTYPKRDNNADQTVTMGAL